MRMKYLLFILIIISYCFFAFTLNNYSVLVSNESSFNRKDRFISNSSISTTANKIREESLLNALSSVPISDTTSLYIRPQNGTSVTIHNRQLPSASMIKVFILEYLFFKTERDNISMSTTLTLRDSDKVGGAGIIGGYETGTELNLDELARLMITESDNTATNMLIDYLGIYNINNYIHKQGYTDTILTRKFMDTTIVDNENRNLTSAQALGLWFTRLANDTMLTTTARETMKSLFI